MPTLSIHIKTEASGLVKQPCIMLSYHSSEDRYPVQKMLIHRRVEHQFVAERHASDEEMKECSHPHRVGFLLYNDWSQLIKDEKEFTDDAAYLSKLEELRKKYKQFDQDSFQPEIKF